jgi:hypothetical protein
MDEDRIGLEFDENRTSALHINLMLMQKVVPRPTLLLTQTDPPIYSIIDLQMLMPRPTPAFFSVGSSSLLKFRKRSFS